MQAAQCTWLGSLAGSLDTQKLHLWPHVSLGFVAARRGGALPCDFLRAAVLAAAAAESDDRD